MGQLIDILSPDLGHQPHFTPDTTAGVKTVDLSMPSITTAVLYNHYGFSKFSKGDNIILLSMGLWLPENFSLASFAPAATGLTGLNLGAYFRVATSDTTYQNIATGNGSIYIPLENYENPIGAYIDAQNFKTLAGVLDDFNLLAALAVPNNTGTARISMLNVPTALNGIKQYCGLFVKVMHNLPLIS